MWCVAIVLLLPEGFDADGSSLLTVGFPLGHFHIFAATDYTLLFLHRFAVPLFIKFNILGVFYVCSLLVFHKTCFNQLLRLHLSEKYLTT